MSEELHDYIRQAKAQGAGHHDIKNNLTSAGWHPAAVDAALAHHAEPAPAPNPSPWSAQPQPAAWNEQPNTLAAASSSQPDAPIAVVHNLSTRGVEYFLMFIALAFVATSLGVLLHDLAGNIFNETNTASFTDGLMSFAGSALIVSLPVFIFLFLRLKKAELQNSALKRDTSRRRAIQIVLILTFLIGMFSLIGYVYQFFNTGVDYGVATETNVGATIADMFITLGIVGGIFIYYWLDGQTKGR